MHIFEHDDTVTATCSRRSGVVTSVTFTPDTAARVTAAAECLPGDPERAEDELYLALSRVCRAPATYVAAQQRVADLLDEMAVEVTLPRRSWTTWIASRGASGGSTERAPAASTGYWPVTW